MASTPENALLASYFDDAMGRLKQMVLHPVGMKESSRAFRQARAAEQPAQVDRLLRLLKTRVSGWVGKNIPQAMRDGRALADRQAKEAGVRPKGSTLGGSFAVIDEGTVGVLARDTAADLHRAADSMGDRAASILRATAQEGLSEADINRILAVGVIEGKPRETIRRLREELRRVHGGQVQIIGRAGEPMNFKVGYYAEMVARTKTREAVVTAQHERLQELDLDLVSIVGRVSTNFCTAFLGQVFSLGGKSTKYAAYDELPEGGPPFHPNCSKSTRPFIESLASGAQLRRAEGLDDAEKLLGMKNAEAQRAFKDLQIYAQQKERYVTTERALFGAS